MRKFIPLAIILCAVVLFAIACQQSADTSTAAASADSIKFNGYASQVKWG